MLPIGEYFTSFLGRQFHDVGVEKRNGTSGVSWDNTAVTRYDTYQDTGNAIRYLSRYIDATIKYWLEVKFQSFSSNYITSKPRCYICVGLGQYC